MRIVEPVSHIFPIPPATRGLGGYDSARKEERGFFAHFQQADRESLVPRAISRRQERQRMEAENWFYPSPIFGGSRGPHH